MPNRVPVCSGERILQTQQPLPQPCPCCWRDPDTALPAAAIWTCGKADLIWHPYHWTTALSCFAKPFKCIFTHIPVIYFLCQSHLATSDAKKWSLFILKTAVTIISIRGLLKKPRRHNQPSYENDQFLTQNHHICSLQHKKDLILTCMYSKGDFFIYHPSKKY